MLKCGLLGKKLGHSYSPLIHRELGDYEYLLYEKQEDELEDFLRNGDWNGLNVTIPYKKDVIPYCDDLGDAVRQTGSANTLVKLADGRIYADNTDVYGFSYLLSKNAVDPAGKKTLVLGNGGASASIQAVLREQGADVIVISRSGADHYNNLDRHKDAQMIVNTTPVGMYPGNGQTPLSLEGFDKLEAVLDIIYNPARTALVLDAQNRGIKSDTGLSMLVAQAVRSSGLFLEKSGVPSHFQENIAAQEITRIEGLLSYEMQNIVLIGMPGCGKSTIARLLGERTGKPVVELDAQLERSTGYFPGTYIKKFGEEAFRKEETAIAAEYGKGSGLILSTGGGIVTRPENYALLHQNGTIFWIRRDLEALPTAGRPISQSQGVTALYAQRKPLYEAFADLTVENNASIEDAVQAIQSMLY